MWYVVQKYFDNGKVVAEVIDGDRAADRLPKPGSYSKYDLYVDEFSSQAEAEDFKKEALNA